MYDKLTDENFLIYAAKHYDGLQCHSTEEFLEDLKRIKYIKKLITRYIENGELKERLILNHLTILNNVFGPEVLSKILYLKMKPQFSYLKPFLILMNVLPEQLYNIKDESIVVTDMIPMDESIIQVLRVMTNGQ
jgi:hypothetical protein